MRFWERLAQLGEPFREVIDRLYAYLPRIVGAALVLLVGWILARTLRHVVVRLLKRLEPVLPGRATVEGDMETLAVRLIGALVFWLVFLISAVVAFEVLGLSSLTTTLAQFAAYLPRLIAAVFIMAGGVILGNVTASWISQVARAANIAYADSVAKAAKVVVVLFATVVALAQAGIDSSLLVVAVGIFFGTFLGAVALAFGLGARPTVSNLIASHYVQRTYRVNQRIRIGPHEGRIVELTPTGVMLDTADGAAFIPAHTFSEEASVLLGDSD
jgi:small-conductance mechanosensitive channel